MWPTKPPVLFEGELTLRLPAPTDSEAIVAACQDPDIAHFTRIPVPYGRDDAETFIANARGCWQEHSAVFFVVIDAEALVATCSLHAVDLDASQAELGYWVAPWARGRHIARDVSVLVTNWGHEVLGLRTIDADVEKLNVASIRTVTAAGYRLLPGERRTELKGTVRVLHRYRHRDEDR